MRENDRIITFQLLKRLKFILLGLSFQKKFNKNNFFLMSMQEIIDQVCLVF